MLTNNFCCCNLTFVTRVISFAGLLLSLVLITILINDKFGNKYDHSRQVALALGLDWQHFHSAANATSEADPEGKIITIVVIVHSFLFMIINLTLLYGTIAEERWCAIFWIISEIICCVSKIGALIYHSVVDNGMLTQLFLTGSVIYIVAVSWCLLVVYTAQKSWKSHRVNFSCWICCGSVDKEDIPLQDMTYTVPSSYVPAVFI